MLIDKYLKHYHYAERHAIKISASVEQIAAELEGLDMSRSRIIRFLFWLRGMPQRMLNKNGLASGGFIELERIQNDEIVIGLIGQFWKPNGNLQRFAPEEFRDFNQPKFLKGVWNFKIIPKHNHCELSTETRVYCTDEKSRKRFARYWFVVKPFSGLIRMEILRSIKKSAEALRPRTTTLAANIS